MFQLNFAFLLSFYLLSQTKIKHETRILNARSTMKMLKQKKDVLRIRSEYCFGWQSILCALFFFTIKFYFTQRILFIIIHASAFVWIAFTATIKSTRSQNFIIEHSELFTRNNTPLLINFFLMYLTHIQTIFYCYIDSRYIPMMNMFLNVYYVHPEDKYFLSFKKLQSRRKIHKSNINNKYSLIFDWTIISSYSIFISVRLMKPNESQIYKKKS